VDPRSQAGGTRGYEMTHSSISSGRRHRRRGILRWLLPGWLVLFLVVGLAPSALAAPGSLDDSFHGDGLATTDFTSKLDFAFDVAISQTDGTIVAAGRAGGSDTRFALARYTSSGALDSTFGGDGKVFTNFTPGFDSAFGVAIQADGKIVAAGAAAGSGGRIAIARYLTNGSLDPSFSGDGKLTTDLTGGDDYAWAVAVQPGDQKIVIAGGAGGSGGRFMLARYNANGTLDGTFGNGGRVFTDFTSRYEYVDAIVIQGDGRILAAGSTNYFGSNPRFALARYETDGDLDTTFSGDGKQTTGFPEGLAWAFGVALETDGDIVAAGQAGSKVALARYSTNGVLDGTFSGDGRRTTNLTAGTDYADEVMIQADGGIVTVGSANYYGADARFAILRYQAGGTLDPTFSGDGMVLTNPSGGVDWALGAVLQPSDEKIVVAGRTSGSGGRFIVGRYLVT
jgi:uncharacterized delta-60 repeat protein